MKRPTDGGGGPKKRAKKASSQQIRTQNGDEALKDGRLDVPAFVAGRAYESDQLENSMERSKKSSKKRAFQTPPRSMRRRTASHNVDRVPKRLRARARAEMATDNTPPQKKVAVRGHERVKKMAEERRHQKATSGHDPDFLGSEDHTGVNELASAPEGRARFHRRQKNKSWLPTHVWHAKRAHMVTRWGFSVAQTPTEKCYRPTHRAHTQDGAIAWDASYFATLVLEAKTVDTLRAALQRLGADDAGGNRYQAGRRVWEGLLSMSDAVLGPASVYWNRQVGDEDRRSVIVRVHPEIFPQVFDLVRASASGDQLTVYDCRYAIGSIDIAGPKSLLALRTVLNPADPDARKNDRWKDLATLTNPASLPSNVAITMMVNDPRLYPPKSFKPAAARTASEDVAADWPDHMTSPSSLLTQEGRTASYQNQSSLKRINERRADNDPTKPLPLLPEDPQIPAILFKRFDNSWTLLLPWGWILPFWHNLMQVSNVRLGGLDQRHQVAYETGHFHFPDDYYFTAAGIKQAEKTADALRTAWESKPRGKRPEYVSLGEIGDPFKPDWKLLHNYTDCVDTDLISPVRLRYTNRGTPAYAARIFSHDNTLIGFVTSGAYNLSIGAGFAMGGVLSSHLTKDSPKTVLIRCVGEKLTREVQWEKMDLTA